jgi:hypothetical protein
MAEGYHEAAKGDSGLRIISLQGKVGEARLGAGPGMEAMVTESENLRTKYPVRKARHAAFHWHPTARQMNFKSMQWRACQGCDCVREEEP